MHLLKHPLLLAFFILLFACKNETKPQYESTSQEKKVLIKYAKGFEIEEKENYSVITLNDTWRGGKTSYQYVLYKNERPEGYENAAFIQVPIKKIACMSATHIAMLDKLNQLTSIVAMSEKSYVSNPKVVKLIAEGKIKEAGTYQGLNYEMLIDEKPDLIMLFGIDESSNKHINKLKELNLNVALNAEYMEAHPLGKLEWIKYMAAFYDMGKEADLVFNEIEKEYIELTQLTKEIKNKPTVFVGMPWNDAWYVPGGGSFVAQFFKDAGTNYLWSDNDERGSYAKSKEVILDEALNADYWLNVNSYTSLDAISGYDGKFKSFDAFKNKKVYNNDKRLNQQMGNDYWESGVVSPQIVLKDLIEIFHPEVLDHELYYYRQLE